MGDPAAARAAASGQSPVGLPCSRRAAPLGAGAEGQGAHSLGDLGPESSGPLPRPPADIFGKVLLLSPRLSASNARPCPPSEGRGPGPVRRRAAAAPSGLALPSPSHPPRRRPHRPGLPEPGGGGGLRGGDASSGEPGRGPLALRAPPPGSLGPGPGGPKRCVGGTPFLLRDSGGYTAGQCFHWGPPRASAFVPF